MTTLHIEHAITDFATWHAAFQRFQDARTRAGVLRHRIYQAVDDPQYVVIDLDSPPAPRPRPCLASSPPRCGRPPPAPQPS